jgi:hypothetical protein
MDSRNPRDIRPGDAITAEALNRLRDTSVQDVSIVGFQKTRRGRQIAFVPPVVIDAPFVLTLYKATANASGGTITVKVVDSDGTVSGDDITLEVLP